MELIVHRLGLESIKTWIGICIDDNLKYGKTATFYRKETILKIVNFSQAQLMIKI